MGPINLHMHKEVIITIWFLFLLMYLDLFRKNKCSNIEDDNK